METDALTEVDGLRDAELDDDALPDGLCDPLGEIDVLGDNDLLVLGLALADPDGDALALADAELDGDGLTDADVLAETEVLGLTDGLTDADIDGELDATAPSTVNKLQVAEEVLSETFSYKFLPDLVRSLYNAPFLNPGYPVGKLFPSAWRIRPAESCKKITLVKYGARFVKKFASVVVRSPTGIA